MMCLRTLVPTTPETGSGGQRHFVETPWLRVGCALFVASEGGQ